MKKIKSVLISVFDKEGLEPLVRILNDNGVRIYSTGGTEKFINDLGITVVPAEEITEYPSILGGRVKTLHPKIHAGILSKRNNKSHKNDLKNNDFDEIQKFLLNRFVIPKYTAQFKLPQQTDDGTFIHHMSI